MQSFVEIKLSDLVMMNNYYFTDSAYCIVKGGSQ